MMGIFCVFLLYVLTCSINGDYDLEEMKDKNIPEKELRTRTELLNDYQLASRQLITDIHEYESYGSVSVMFYRIMTDVTEARFTFLSKDLGTCTPATIVVNLKYGAYPAVNPDGYDFPKKFISSTKREYIHTLELLSNKSSISYSIENPKPGNWYAVVYLKWIDPRTIKSATWNTRFHYQGPSSECQTILYTDLQVKRIENIELIDCYTDVVIDYDQLPVLYKCMSQDSVKAIRFNMKIAMFTDIADQELYFRVGAQTIPTKDSNIIYCVFDPNVNNAPAITFAPHTATWHYIQVGKVEGNASSLPKCESIKFRPFRTDFDELPNITMTELVRANKGRFFGFDYSLPSCKKKGAPSLINITSFEVKTLRFKMNQFLDIGGSLVITAGILANLKYSHKYQKKFIVKLQQTADKQFIRAVICLDIGYPSMPLFNGSCKYNDKVNPALFVLNSKYSKPVYDMTYIPYPDSGMWYLTLKIFCIDCTTNEFTSTTCFPTLDKERLSNVISSNVTRVGTSECNATLMLKVSSMPCVNGQCSHRGTCQLKAVGGLAMSFCVCSYGYGGWDCSDGKRAGNLAYKTTCVLLLTLSNLLYIFSVYVASIRYYYAEATMYACTLFFSTFYHACVAPPDVAYCITRGPVLQFGDFFCGIMSFWMTIIAMSTITDKFKESLYVVGGVVIAVLLRLDRHSFICFLVPITTGVVILFTSWYIDYKITGKMKYPTSYYLRYMPIGLILGFLGTILFIYLQAEENYVYVHSIWHIVIALSIVFLLPDMRQDNNGNLFKPSPNTCNFNICKYFSNSRPTGASDSQPER